jgi:hypothetical protein
VLERPRLSQLHEWLTSGTRALLASLAKNSKDPPRATPVAIQILRQIVSTEYSHETLARDMERLNERAAVYWLCRLRALLTDAGREAVLRRALAVAHAGGQLTEQQIQILVDAAMAVGLSSAALRGLNHEAAALSIRPAMTEMTAGRALSVLGLRSGATPREVNESFNELMRSAVNEPGSANGRIRTQELLAAREILIAHTGKAGADASELGSREEARREEVASDADEVWCSMAAVWNRASQSVTVEPPSASTSQAPGRIAGKAKVPHPTLLRHIFRRRWLIVIGALGLVLAFHALTGESSGRPGQCWAEEGAGTIVPTLCSVDEARWVTTLIVDDPTNCSDWYVELGGDTYGCLARRY